MAEIPVELAENVARHVAEALGARAVVVGEDGRVVASSGTGDGSGDAALHFPIRLDGASVQLLVDGAVLRDRMPDRLRRMLVELLVGQATAAGARRNDVLKDRFIHELLRDGVQNEAEVLREAQILGLDMRRPRAVILVDASAYLLEQPGASTQARERAQVVIGAIVHHFQLPSDTICAHIGQGEVVVLKAIRRQDLGVWVERGGHVSITKASWANLAALKSASAELLTQLRMRTGAPMTIGVGRYHPRIRGLARSYQDARAALHLGERLFGRGQVYSLDQLGAAAMVGVPDERTRLDLAQRLLAPLDAEPELKETLDAFLAQDRSLSRTADLLSIHRNTLGYRLDKIAALTDLDPRRFDDAVQLRLATLVRSLVGEASLGRVHENAPRVPPILRSPAQTRG